MSRKRSKKYKIREKVWLYPGETANWHFVYVSKNASNDIKQKQEGKQRRGFGAVKVEAQIRKTKWQTSIFPDRLSGQYLLPLKAKIRKAEDIFSGDTITFTIKPWI